MRATCAEYAGGRITLAANRQFQVIRPMIGGTVFSETTWMPCAQLIGMLTSLSWQATSHWRITDLSEFSRVHVGTQRAVPIDSRHPVGARRKDASEGVSTCLPSLSG